MASLAPAQPETPDTASLEGDSSDENVEVIPVSDDETSETVNVAPPADTETPPTLTLPQAPRSRVETRPIAALDIMRRLPTRDLAPDRSADAAEALVPRRRDDLANQDPPTLPTVTIPLRTYSRPITAHGERHRRLGLLERFGHEGHMRPTLPPGINLITSVATTHALVATAAALTAAAIAVMTPNRALWALALALIAGVGAGLAFVAGQRRAYARGALWLLLSELGMLGWALATLGPRPALALLAAGSVALALRARGRTSAVCVLVGALTLYAASLIVTFTRVWLAPVTLSALPSALLDATCVAVGLTLTLGAMAGWSSSRTKAEAAAEANRHEAAFVRRGATAARERTEYDAERLTMALGAALQGRGLTKPAQAEGPLSPLADTINVAAERIATLQRDREDRLRLEGALNGVIRAVERAWLGLSWAWPDPSGTPLDDLVALLRAPRPQDVLQDTASTPSGAYETARNPAPDGRADDEDDVRPSGADTDAGYGSFVGATDMDSPVRLGNYPSWPDKLSADAHEFSSRSAPSQPSFPVVEVHRQYFPTPEESLGAADEMGEMGEMGEIGEIGEMDANDPAAFGRFAPFDSPSWAPAPGSWPGSWSDPWSDDDFDDPDDSASRHLAPPPSRRRWNEWSSQSGGDSRHDARPDANQDSGQTGG